MPGCRFRPTSTPAARASHDPPAPMSRGALIDVRNRTRAASGAGGHTGACGAWAGHAVRPATVPASDRTRIAVRFFFIS